MADHKVFSTAALRLASAATITGSLPPHSKTTGIMLAAHVAATNLAVLVDPVKANLLISLSHKYLPVSPKPVITWKISSFGATWANESANHTPTAGVNSLGLNTTALPAASA